MISAIIAKFLGIFLKFSYGGVIFMMALESTFFPLPSELVIPPAAYLAATGKMNLFLVIISGTAGSVVGALINYYLGLKLGRPIIYKLASTKLAHMMLVNEDKIKKSEEYFLKHGKMSTFFGRLIIGVRHLISIPAGMSKMDIKIFTFYTFVGSFIWVSFLSILGYYFGANQELLMKYYKEISYGLGIVLVIIGIICIAYKSRKKD